MQHRARRRARRRALACGQASAGAPMERRAQGRAMTSVEAYGAGLAFERSHTVHTFVLTPKHLKCSPVLTPHSAQVFTQ
eukprot:3959562-Prymnesium_polylepis.1